MIFRSTRRENPDSVTFLKQQTEEACGGGGRAALPFNGIHSERGLDMRVRGTKLAVIPMLVGFVVASLTSHDGTVAQDQGYGGPPPEQSNEDSAVVPKKGYGGGVGRQPHETFSFPGGTLEDYLKRLREHYAPETRLAPIKLSPEVENVSIPPVEIANPRPTSMVDYLRAMGTQSGKYRLVDHHYGDTGYWTVEAPPYDTRVFSLAEYLVTESGWSSSKLKDVISGVEAALALDDNLVPEPKIKFHPDTRLLLVAGTTEQVRIAESVVEQLKSSATAIDSVKEMKSTIRELTKELNETRALLRAAKTGAVEDTDALDSVSRQDEG